MRLLARDLGAVSGKLKIEADTAKASVFELTTLLEKSPRETLMIMKHKILNEELEGAKATILELQDNLAQLKMDAAAARRAQSVKLSDIHDTNDELLPTVLAALHNSGEEQHWQTRNAHLPDHLKIVLPATISPRVAESAHTKKMMQVQTSIQRMLRLVQLASNDSFDAPGNISQTIHELNRSESNLDDTLHTVSINAMCRVAASPHRIVLSSSNSCNSKNPLFDHDAAIRIQGAVRSHIARQRAREIILQNYHYHELASASNASDKDGRTLWPIVAEDGCAEGEGGDDKESGCAEGYAIDGYLSASQVTGWLLSRCVLCGEHESKHEMLNLDAIEKQDAHIRYCCNGGKRAAEENGIAPIINSQGAVSNKRGAAEGKGAGRVEIDLHLQVRNEMKTEDGHVKVRAHVHVDDDADDGGFLGGSMEDAFGDKLQSQPEDENEDGFSDSGPDPPCVDGVLGVELQLQIEEDQQGHIGQIHIHVLVSEDVCVSDNDVSAIVTARGGRGMQRAGGGAVEETDSEKEDEQITHHHDAHICIPHCQRAEATHTRAQAAHTRDPSLSPRPEILSRFSLSLLPCVASATPSSASSAVSHTLCHGPRDEIGGVLALHNLDDMIYALTRLESFVQSTTQHATQHNATQHVSAEAEGQASDEMGKREKESSFVWQSHQNEACSDNIENEMRLSISQSMKEKYQQMLSELEGELGGGVLGQVWQIP